MTSTPDQTNTENTERLRGPLAMDVIVAAADRHGVCTRPMVLQAIDQDTGKHHYIPVPCGSTVEAKCGPCARKAKALRITQCREGWHLDTEPETSTATPTGDHLALLARRADLVQRYRHAVDTGRAGDADEIREDIRSVDVQLRALGVRGRLPSPDMTEKRPVTRSTKRRQDAPNLPRRTVTSSTIGREYAGKYRPSMFITLTLDTYGRVHSDGTPIDPAAYDYRRAARDVVHFAALVDRWWQNLRRVVGWDVQYFATVEPQKRATPHLHAAVRGSIPREILRQVTAATYHQVWWPNHDQPIYGKNRLPVWDHHRKSFMDPDTREPLTSWRDAVNQVDQPAHVVTFGEQVHSKGILGGTEESGRHIGYLTKYLTKATGEIVQASTVRQAAHHDRLHAELAVTPCSPRCGIWALYGINPLGATSKTIPGHCKGRAHRRTTLGLPGRRVLVSRKWSGKTLTDHKADRKTFVTELLDAVGIEKDEPDTARLIWRPIPPGHPGIPPRAHLLGQAIAQRITWHAEYQRALLAAAESAGCFGNSGGESS